MKSHTALLAISTLFAACGEVSEQGPDASHADAALADATSIDASGDAAASDAAPLTGRDCKAIHARAPGAPSGTYTIDPDGEGGRAAFSAPCDMTSRGGGWTIVFLSGKTNYEATPIGYGYATAALLDTATEAMVAFRRPDLSPFANDAVLAFPDAWKTGCPLDAVAVDLPVTVSIDGAVPQSSTLRYGTSNFSQLCSDAWSAPTVAPYGRFCFQDTSGPYFSGFDNASGDFCTDSSKPYSSAGCSDGVRFSIALR
jgi:hypothetical protein